MIYTTYFAKLNKLPAGVVPISICGKAPDWYKGKEYKKLAPKYSFFSQWKEDHDDEAYTRCYEEQVLGSLNIDDVKDEIYMLGDSDDIALVCYEKPESFCHRHLVAKWFNEHCHTNEDFVAEI